MRASAPQREKTRRDACIVCAHGPCDPAHVIPRAMGGCDHPDCVAPLCRRCHRLYDTGELDLLPHLEPYRRDELAHAVAHVGLICALERITNTRWQPIPDHA